MKMIIRLSESDLTRIVKRVIREQSPFAPGMGPKTPTPAGVNPTNKPSIKDTDEFASEAEKEANEKEFRDFIKQQSYYISDFVPVGGTIMFDPYDPKKGTARATSYDQGAHPSSMRISKENLPKDLYTNPCYSNFDAHEEDGSLRRLDVKMSCKKEYRNLVYLMKKENKFLNNKAVNRSLTAAKNELSKK